MAFSPDGSLLATDEQESQHVVIYDARSGARRHLLDAPNSDELMPAPVSLSAGRSLLIMCRGVWDPGSARQIRRLEPGDVVSPDGRWLARHGEMPWIDICDLETGAVEKRVGLKDNRFTAHPAVITALALAGSGPGSHREGALCSAIAGSGAVKSIWPASCACGSTDPTSHGAAEERLRCGLGELAAPRRCFEPYNENSEWIARR